MNKNEIMKIETESGQVELSNNIVRNQIAKGRDITDEEIYNFMLLCKYRKLNPFLNQAHLVKFGDNVQMVVGKDVFTDRLNKNPNCEGWESGVITYNKETNEVTEREGTFYLPHEKLAGAYCIIHRKGWKKPFKWTIKVGDYLRTTTKNGEKIPMGQWKTMPGVMLTKCCIVATVRNVFPEEFGGMYSHEELGVNEDNIKNAIDITPSEEKTKEKKDPVKEESKKEKVISKDQLKLLCASAKSTDKAIAKSYDPKALLDYVMDRFEKSGYLESASKKDIPVSKFDNILGEVKKLVIKKENEWNKKNGMEEKKEEEAKKDEKKKEEPFKKIDDLDDSLPLPDESQFAKPANNKDKEDNKDG